MKLGTPEHPKTLDLQQRLSCSKLEAVGALECLWHWTARYAPAGDVGRWSDAAIAAGVGWAGDAAAFVAALHDAGWLDAHAGSRLIVHDWPKNCPDYIHRQLARALQTFADGTGPSLKRLSKKERAAIKRRRGDSAHAGRTPGAQSAPQGALPNRSVPGQATPNLTTPAADAASAPPARGSADRQAEAANPLVNRPALVSEGHALITAIAAAESLDPTEVLARASTGNGRFKGSAKVRLDTMTDDRLALTVTDLRAWQRRLPKQEQPSPESLARIELVRALRDQPGILEPQAWDAIRKLLEQRINPHAFATWFRPTASPGHVLWGEVEVVVVLVPDEKFRDWLDRNYRHEVDRCTTAQHGVAWRVEFVTQDEVALSGVTLAAA